MKKPLNAARTALIAVLLLGPLSAGAVAYTESLSTCSSSPYTCASLPGRINIGTTTAFSVASPLSTASGCTFYVKGAAWFQLGLGSNSGGARRSQCDWDTLNGGTLDTVLSANLNAQPSTTRSVQCTSGNGPAPLTGTYGRDNTACN
jgi:hypothetical protein